MKLFQRLALATLGATLSWTAWKASPSFAATFRVNNTNDAGEGSLRQAILDANNASGDNSIDFLLDLSNN